MKAHGVDFSTLQDALGIPEQGAYGPVLVEDGDGFRLGLYDDDAPPCSEDEWDEDVETEAESEEPGRWCREYDKFCGPACEEEWAVVVYPMPPTWTAADSCIVVPRDALCNAPVGARSAGDLVAAVKGSGFFYAVLLAPELSRTRVKFGYSDNVPRRLASYRTSNPTAVLVGAWPCLSGAESNALAVVSRQGRAVGGEVYECDDFDGVVRDLDSFFAAN